MFIKIAVLTYKKIIMAERRRGGSYHNKRSKNNERDQGESSSSTSFARSGPPRNKNIPPGLRGKQIGLYYANRNRKKMEEEKSKPLGVIWLSDSRKRQIKELLDYIAKNPFEFNDLSKKSKAGEGDGYQIPDSAFKKQFLEIVNGTIDDKLNNDRLYKPLIRNPKIDLKYLNELLNDKENNSQYKQMQRTRIKLPSYDKRHEILQAINNSQVIVISGETGCGKTTQVAQFILDDYILSEKGSVCKVICTQPRRISAISVAERVAQERGEKCGSASVGYQIRLEKRLPRSTGSILFCTTGVLLKQMESDPFLSGISHLILDEIHERDIVSDFLITLIKHVITKRNDLKLILMSATLNSEQFSKYYNNCIIINIPGFTFPVKEYYLEDILMRVEHEFPPYKEITDGRKHLKHYIMKKKAIREYFYFIEPHVRTLKAKKSYPTHICDMLFNPNTELMDIQLIYKLILHICTKEEEGAILVFLPGYTDISKLHSELENSRNFPRSNYVIIALHSKMSSIQQRQVFETPPKGVRKIVIATNIAETSITINDVVFVIDSGRVKLKNYDADYNIESLKPQWETLANANQRKGRAGRVKPGICYHMFSRARNMMLEMHPKPEMLRTRLENVILTIKILQLGNIQAFLAKVMDPPLPQAVVNSVNFLKRINALDCQAKLTPLGYHLARLPLQPQMGKMILLGAIFSCLDPVLSIAASLDFKDAFQLPLGKEKEVTRKKRKLLPGWRSDHLILAEALNRYEEALLHRNAKEFCWEYFLSSYTLELLRDMKNQFATYLHDMNFLSNSNPKSGEWNKNSDNLSLVKAIICAGLYPNVAIIRNINRVGRKRIYTLENENVKIHPGSVNDKENVFESKILMYYLKLKSNNIYLHDTSNVHPLPLLFFGDNIKIEMENGQTLISMSDVLRFKCNDNTAVYIKEMRSHLDDLLEYKVTNPGIIDWTTNNKEVAILKAIIELITSEDVGVLEYDDDCNYSD